MTKDTTDMEILRTALRGVSALDPHDAAKEVYDLLTPKQRDAVLRAALPSLITDIYRTTRLSLALQVRSDQPRSTKASRIASWYQRWIATPVYVNDTWKTLATCTVDDILFLSADRFRRSDDLREEGQRWENIAILMKDSRASYVSELPEDAVRDVIM